MSAHLSPDRAQVEEAVRALYKADMVTEVRAFNTARGTVSGYFDDLDVLVDSIAEIGERAPGVFVTLNPVRTDLLERSPNALVEHVRKTTSDEEIDGLRWLPVDVDPVRPSGVPSTEAEKAAAEARATEIVADLSGRGWPAPIIADSGNGAHLLFQVSLNNDEGGRGLVQRALDALAFLFSDEAVRVDTSVGNPARI